MQAFIFVFDKTHEKAKSHNFKPSFIRHPRRLLNETPAKRCQGYALSLFNTQQNLEKHYLKLKQSTPNISETLGDWIAEGFIEETDGLASKVDSRGHFSLHEFENTDLEIKFNLMSSLD
jgi:hypothetical protein